MKHQKTPNKIELEMVARQTIARKRLEGMETIPAEWSKYCSNSQKYRSLLHMPARIWKEVGAISHIR